MGIAVQFSYPLWLASFPELAYINAGASITASIAEAALSVSAVSFGTLAVGQILSDATGALLPSTVILAGSGAAWTVSNSQTVASEAMTTTGVVQAAFQRATSIQNNTGVGPPFDAPTQTYLLNLLTAHIALLNAPNPNGSSASSIVGRISDATQGSVHVAAEMDVPAGSAQWYNTTRYGSEYWLATSRFRTAIYFPGQGGYARGTPGGRPLGYPWNYGGPY